MNSKHQLNEILQNVFFLQNLNHDQSSQCIWSNGQYTKEQLVDQFSTRIAPSNDQILSPPTTHLFATGKLELYGGDGIKNNAGGARSVIIGNVCVKGVGRNRLSSPSDRLELSYGGLDLYSAIQEIVNSQVISSVLPIGALKILGLIFNDEKSGIYYDGTSCYSVLLIREYAIRPANFLPISALARKTICFAGDHSDEFRMRYLYQEIHKNMGAHKFIELLNFFADNSSSQIGKACMIRLLHGAISDSNVAIDGSWLDTSTCGFVPAGNNWSMQTSMSDEQFSPKNMILKLAYNYHKYNRYPINFPHIIERYERGLVRHKRINSGFYFGIDSTVLEKFLSHDTFVYFGIVIEKLLVAKDGSLVKRYPRDAEYNPLISTYTKLWSLMIQDSSEGVDGLANNDALVVLEVLKTIAENIDLCDLKSIIICSLKRLHFSKAYRPSDPKSEIDALIVHDRTSDNLFAIEKHIDEKIDNIRWVFESSGLPEITIIKTSNFSLAFGRLDGQYIFKGPQNTYFSSEFTKIALELEVHQALSDNERIYLHNLKNLLISLESV